MPVPTLWGWILLAVLALLGWLAVPPLVQGFGLLNLAIGALVGYVVVMLVPALRQHEASPPPRRR